MVRTLYILDIIYWDSGAQTKRCLVQNPPVITFEVASSFLPVRSKSPTSSPLAFKFKLVHNDDSDRFSEHGFSTISKPRSYY